MRLSVLTVFEACMVLVLLIVIMYRHFIGIGLNLTYDSYAVIVLAFFLGMLVRDIIQG